MKRRSFLKKAGAVTILIAGDRVWRASAQDIPEVGAGPAFEPWTTWRRNSNRSAVALVRAAILSSNAYNSQPWFFLVSKTSVEIYADTQRNLGAFDPYLRELHFSLGCALENLLLAAAADGLAASVTYAPGVLAPVGAHHNRQLVARVDLGPGRPVQSELHDAIPHRHTNRHPFDAQKAIPQAFVASLDKASQDADDVKLFLFTAESQRQTIANLIEAASTTFMSNPEVSHSTKRWFRTASQYQRLKDGVLAGSPDPTPAAGSDPGAPQIYVEMMLTGRLFGVIAVRNRYDRAQTIRAGRIWQRAHLLATARGLAARPANGAVELIDHERRLGHAPQAAARLAAITKDAAWQPTFMFYMGYPTRPAPASARRPVEAVAILRGYESPIRL